MGRAPCCDKANVKKGPWSPEEDTQLKHFIQTYGTGGNWISLPHKAGMFLKNHDLHNGMILSILSINSRSFAFVLPYKAS